MHHLVFVDVYVDGTKRVANTLYLDGVTRYGYLPLPNFVQLLPNLKVTSGRVSSEDFLQVLPCFFRRLGVLNVAKNVFMDTCCQTLHYPTCSLLPCWVVGISDVGFVF